MRTKSTENIEKFIRIALVILTAFLCVTTFLGGIALIADLTGLPVDLLQGSPFTNYTIPGLALSVIAGGSAAAAAWLLIRKSKYALLGSTTAGTVIMFFEFIEVLVIGSEPGIARTLQVIYFGLGTLIIVISMLAWFIQLRGKTD